MVGDVVGRGLSAATAMGQLRSAMSALALAVERPRDILAALDRYAPQIDGARLATIVIARIDPLNHVFQYASAGHMPGVVVMPGGATELLEPDRSLPLDALPEAPRDEIEHAFPPGATLVLYTDGLVERRGESLDVGFRRLTRACAELGRLDVDTMCEHLVSALLPRQEQRDDVAVVCVRLDDEPADAMRRRFRADPGELAQVRHDLREWLLQAGLSPERAGDLVLAVDEACANAVEHAYDGDTTGEVVVEVSARTRPGGDRLGAGRRPLARCALSSEPRPRPAHHRSRRRRARHPDWLHRDDAAPPQREPSARDLTQAERGDAP